MAQSVGQRVIQTLQTTVIGQTGVSPTGAVIFLHGSGDNGHGVQDWVQGLMNQQFMFSHLKVIFPSAPFMPYTLYGGDPSTVWFDRLDLSPMAPEHLESVNSMAENLKALVLKEVDSGIPLERIAIGGFSMGGAMSLHLAYRYLPQVAGVFGLSCFLNENSEVYKALEVGQLENQTAPPLFQTHGDNDTLVPSAWGNATHLKLSQLGVNASFRSFPRTEHELKKPALKALYSWLLDRIPV
ncbi:Hypothetical predicted protein [Cloeon dipterum]|uniref:palmitoyl-protein hydrolase n=1 Tax=Cloeon dipterum TaxID=197152 RepID=A0A8S1CK46_9INSE|nr:Hypothetical predicted protein [Cloeon dipterum]